MSPPPLRAQAKTPEPPAAVKMVRPQRGEIARNVSLPATVAANQQVTLYAKVGGYLKAIHVDKGDAVQAGDLLAEIEVPELIAEQAKAKAELAIATLDSQRLDAAQAKAPDLVVPQSLDAARAKMTIAQAAVEKAETMLAFTRITAPFAGIVNKRFVDAGAFIPAATSGGNPQNAALLGLADFRTVRVQIAVPEPEVPLIKKGLPVKVMVDELPGRNFSGTVTRLAYTLDDLSKTMLTEVDLENAAGELRPGMYALAKISVEKHADALLLPVEAVLVEKSGPSVFKVIEGKAKKVPVKTGFNDGVSVEMLEGVTGDEAVVLVGKMTLNNGQAVTITETK